MNQLLKVDIFRKGKTTTCKSFRFDVTQKKKMEVFISPKRSLQLYAYFHNLKIYI